MTDTEKSSSVRNTVCYNSSSEDTSEDADSSIGEETNDAEVIIWNYRALTFLDAIEARNWLNQPPQKIFSHYYCNKTFDGDKVYYRCNLVKKKGPQCNKKIILQYNATDDSVFMHESANQHNHDQINADVQKIGINAPMFSTWCVHFSVDNWLASKCTCPSFLKKNICKHVVGVASIKKCIRIPSECKNVELEEKAKPGRKKHAVKALQLQPPNRTAAPHEEIPLQQQQETQQQEEQVTANPTQPKKQRAKRRTKAEMMAARSALNVENQTKRKRRA